MDNRELMGIRADTLFAYDGRGRMLGSNSPDRHPAPRLFLGCTPAGYVARLSATVPDALAGRITGIIERQPPPGDLRAPPAALAALAALREALEGHAPITAETAGPAYRFPASIAPPSEAVQLTEANVQVARTSYPWLLDELPDWWPCFAVVQDGAAVSVCFSSRIGVEAAEAGVETLPDFRGRGYAVAVTAAWGAAIRASGRIPLYSTAWENLASQGVARHLGLIMFGTDITWA
ncbi:MAG: GNAT family N-acetyltransferase [Dehalococcoidia bacterium]